MTCKDVLELVIKNKRWGNCIAKRNIYWRVDPYLGTNIWHYYCCYAACNPGCQYTQLRREQSCVGELNRESLGWQQHVKFVACHACSLNFCRKRKDKALGLHVSTLWCRRGQIAQRVSCYVLAFECTGINRWRLKDFRLILSRDNTCRKRKQNASDCRQNSVLESIIWPVAFWANFYLHF